MTKNDKIRLLAHAICMLETSYTNEHTAVKQIAKEIAYIVNGNPNFAIFCAIGQHPKDIHKEVAEALKKDLKFDIDPYQPF